MKKFIHKYRNPNEKDFNYPLINRECDGSLVDYIVDCCKSLEVLNYITFTGYEYISDESEIDTSEYINARARGRLKNENIKRFMLLDDSRCAELRLRFHLECEGETADIVKKILVPIPDDDMYYLIKGTRYLLMYQIVDNSTYTTKKNLTLKTMMPVPVQMAIEKFNDIDDVTFYAPLYTLQLFKKNINILLFYFARFGFDKTLVYFSLDRIVKIIDTPDRDNKDVIIFSINSKMYLEVNRKFFEKYQYVRTMVVMMLNLMTSRMNMELLNDTEYWVTYIGSIGTVNKNKQFEKGMSTLMLFNRMLDDTTKKILKVHPMHKHDIYAILRWMIMHFDDLRKKDNLDLNNRRLRCNEYIAALLTTTFSERVSRVISLGSKATMAKVKDIFKFPGDILITQLHKSGLLRFDDRVNDMDFFGKIRVTLKGPNSLGGTNENNIAAKYRGVDPSYIGRIDLNVCGTSDPGTGAVLTPSCKTDGLYFNAENEPENFKYLFDKDIYESIIKQAQAIYVGGTFDSMEDYFDYHVSMADVNDALTSNMKINNIHLIDVTSQPKPVEEITDDEEDYISDDVDITVED